MSSHVVYGADAVKDRQGWVLGLTGGQFLMLVLGIVPTWLVVKSEHYLWLLAALPFAIGMFVAVCVPHRGHSLYQWIGIKARFQLGILFRWSVWQSKTAGGDFPMTEAELGVADYPGMLRGIKYKDGPELNGWKIRPAIIEDSTARTWAMTARVEHPGIALAGPDERRIMGNALAQLHESAARTGVLHLLTIQVRISLDDGAERSEWLRANADPTPSPKIDAIYDELDRTGALIGARKVDTFITIVVKEDVLKREIRGKVGGFNARATAMYAIADEYTRFFQGGLKCDSVEWLTTTKLAIAIHTGFNPGAARDLNTSLIEAAKNSDYAPGIPVAATGPAHAIPEMRYYHHGGWKSACSTLGMPDDGLMMGNLRSVITPSRPGEHRFLTVFFHPLTQEKAKKNTIKEETSADVSGWVRNWAGTRTTSDDRRDARNIYRREDALSAGKALVKCWAAAAITVPETWNDQDFGGVLDSSIRISGYVPLTLDGAHDAAFSVAAIPVGVGLPKLRD